MKLLNITLFLLFCNYHITAQTISKTKDSVIIEEIKMLLDSSDISLYKLGDLNKSLKYNLQVIKKAEEINNSYYLHKGYRYAAYDYLAMQDTLTAIKSTEIAYSYALQLKDSAAIADCYMDFANIYQLGNNYSLVQTNIDKAITIFKRLKDSTRLFKAYFNDYQNALSNNDFEGSRNSLKKATELKKHFNFNGPYEFDIAWGDLYLYFNKPDSANYFYEKVINASKGKSDSLELLRIYLNYGRSLYDTKNYKKAFEISELYQNHLVKIEQLEYDENVSKASAQFKVDTYKQSAVQTELLNKLQKSQLKNRTRIIILFSVLIASLVAALSYYIYSLNKRKEYEKRLKLKNQEYLAAKEESERLAEEKNNFFSTVSHELRTPLYGVIGMSSVLLDDPKLTSKSKEDLKTLKFSADYLLALINDVLQISKIDARKITTQKNIFQLRELISSILSSFEYIRRQNNNSITTIIAPSVPDTLEGNTVVISQILMNLVGNATKFIENGEIILEITTIKQNEENIDLQFSIRDNGPGIPLEKQKEIFAEFAQLDNQHSYQGTGLGLPIVSKLLKLSGSKINLISNPGEGSNFFFTLQLRIMPTESYNEKIEQIVVDEEVLAQQKILIVDDNAINRIVTERILSRYNVTTGIAENGQEAIDKVQKEHFDLILMDINMPVMNGLDATIKIRELGYTLPIIALTAVEAEKLRNEIFNTGLDDIIIKPYDIDLFKETIITNLLGKQTKIAL